MRKKGFKGKCEKISLSKSKEICRTYNLEYRIRVFETTRRFKNADGTQVKKKYKNAWKVERI